MARVFDLLAAQYGWTDADILDLPLARIRQAVAAATERLWRTDLERRRLATAQLRAVCTFISLTVPTKEGVDSPMVNMAARLDLGPGTEDPAPADHPAAVTDDHDGGGREGVATISLDDLPEEPGDAVHAGRPPAAAEYAAAGRP